MSLREKSIEAMAKAWVAYEGDEWDDINSSGMAAVKACVEREFDALLDVLAENADEWEMEVDDAYWNALTSGDFDRIEEFVTRRLVTFLRGGEG